MIEEIHIRDLGIITDARLPLEPGFSVLTGETGAGKTMVVTALGMLLGARSDASSVRNGAKSALAEAVIRLPHGHRALELAEEAGGTAEDIDEQTSELRLLLQSTASPISCASNQRQSSASPSTCTPAKSSPTCWRSTAKTTNDTAPPPQS